MTILQPKGVIIILYNVILHRFVLLLDFTCGR